MRPLVRRAAMVLMLAAAIPGRSLAAPELPELCVIATDEAGDAGRPLLPLRAAPDPATDITSVAIGSDSSVLALVIGVADLSGAVPEGTTQRWDASWRVGDAGHYISIERSADWISATYDYEAVPVQADADSATLTVLVDRDALAEPDGAKLGGIAVTSAVTSLLLWSGGDSAPEYGAEGADYILGLPCGATPPQLCPVVGDEAGDAGPFFRFDGAEIPPNQAALDILTAGATATADELTVQTRVGDLTAGPPPGYDTVGWTISWTLGEERLYAQGYRASDGAVVWSYGAASGSGAPAGPTFGGTAANGTLDMTTGLIAITVPRAVIGNPADGTPLTAFGAASWAMRGGSTVAAAQVVDTTETGDYQTGLACGA